MHKLAFLVPVEDAEIVKQAVFEADADRIWMCESVYF
jgi:hypothetical protein